MPCLGRKQLIKKLIELGAADFRAGKPINAFYDVPLKIMGPRRRANESFRAAYELGWRGEKGASHHG